MMDEKSHTAGVAALSIVAPPPQPLVAIIVPVYKHSVLLAEALTSALSQQTNFEFVIVVVNDGCPLPESHQACLDFATAAPDRVHYIRRRNGGLSAARNTGIEYVLATWETVRAIYFLDADNRLLPRAMQRAYDALSQNPQAGWLYPDIDMIGQEWHSDYSGDYSVLRHLDENICEAGSIVRRAVFEQGARFDESMKLGFEDWEFWLSAIELGFRGQHLENFGFRYRKRPESMLSDSERDRPEIVSYIHRKHVDLFRYRALMATEHAEAPRYAICASDSLTVRLTSDPLADGLVLPLDAFCRHYYRARAAAARYARPPLLAVIDPAFERMLRDFRLSRWAFWLLETAIDDCSFAYVIAEPDRLADRIEILQIDEDEVGEAFHSAGLVMVRAGLFDECLDNSLDSWIMSLAGSQPQPKIGAIELRLPTADALSPGGANCGLLTLFRGMREFQSTIYRGPSWSWRSQLSPKEELFKVTRRLLNASPVYPRVARTRQRRIGFVVPFAEFGGVEKTAYSLAEILRQNYWSPELFIFCRQSAQPVSRIAEIFDSVNFLCDPQAGTWDPQLRYMGSHYPSWIAVGRHARAFGLLSGLDVVANFHCAEAHALMAPLRRQGAKTIASLHVIDLSECDRPKGHPYMTLGYEHVYDVLTCCSQQLFDWCHAMGVPDAKLSLLRSAPSYDLPPGAAAAALAARHGRAATALRVLFLGRLDRQKGLDRLMAIVRLSRHLGLPIEWRLVGAAVIGDAECHDLEEAGVAIEPPRLTPAELTECYCWADVVLLVSRWEGLPLTVLEAMRLGAVVCATEVGAVAEAIVDNVTGFLLPRTGSGVIARAAVSILHALHRDPALLLRIAAAAAHASEPWTWANSATELLARLDRLVAA